jgi:predicted DNA-binding transcriptional regulator AlpA
MTTDTTSRLVSRAEFAQRLGLSVRTLENWEKSGYGPKPFRVGTRTVRYHASEIEGFIKGMEIQTIAACS